jgi:hypothetical protein
MDPNENIKQQRELAARIVAAMEDGNITNSMICTLADGLAGLVIALDEWRTAGGFDPYGKSWTNAALLERIATLATDHPDDIGAIARVRRLLLAAG